MKQKWKRLILAVLTAALLMPSSRGETVPSDMPGNAVESVLNGMTLEEKVGQMLIASFRTWKEGSINSGSGAKAVTELNEEMRAFLAAYHVGGTTLFAENCRDAEQTLTLVSDLQKANQAGGGLPLLVTVDQEGGSIVRLGFGTTGPGNMALAATGNPQNAVLMAKVYGEEMRLLGIHADFAPVVDVNNNPNNPVIGVRAFSDDPLVTARYGAAYVEGLHLAGTMATLKHFPGHGNTDTDSHTSFPRIDATLEELQACELVPFQAGIDAGADMVMTAHIQYPRIEPKTYVSISTGESVFLPATMSRTILTGVLRNQMGFEGVIVSDSLDMAAISDHFTDEDILRLTIEAGIDMLILPIVRDSVIFQRVRNMAETAIRLVREGEISMERIDSSVRRILTLKMKYGLLAKTDFSVSQALVSAAVNGVGSEENRLTAWLITQKALTLVKNENSAFPLHLQPGDKTLILFADSCASRSGAGALAERILSDQGMLPEGAKITVMTNTYDNGATCLYAAKRADHVILVNRVYQSECLNPNTGDGFSTSTFDRIIEMRHEKGLPVILVSCQLPYDAARFPEADAVLLAYASSAMRTVPPTAGEGSAYAPNLPCALCTCFGMGEALGQLPVSLPALSDEYTLTTDIYLPIGVR